MSNGLTFKILTISRNFQNRHRNTIKECVQNFTEFDRELTEKAAKNTHIFSDLCDRRSVRGLITPHPTKCDTSTYTAMDGNQDHLIINILLCMVVLLSTIMRAIMLLVVILLYAYPFVQDQNLFVQHQNPFLLCASLFVLHQHAFVLIYHSFLHY